MRSLSSLLQAPGRASTDKDLLDHLELLLDASKELLEAAAAIEEELGRRRVERFRENLG
jgi:hypothetical protein